MQFRSLKTLAMAAAVIGATAGFASAQSTWPEAGKMVTVINGGSPGSGQDLTARLVADALQNLHPGSNFQVVAKPGAGTQLAYQAIADAPKDGYTFGIMSLPTFATVYLDKARQANFTRESFAPAANFIFDPGAIAVRAESPFKTLQDLIAAAKAKPGEVTVAVVGPKSREHLDVTAVEQAAGVKFNPIFHNDSGTGLNNLLGGNVDAAQGSVGDYLAQIAAGRVRILAVFAKEPSIFAPDVPTAESAGVPVFSGVTRGFTFPAGVDPAIVKQVSDDIGKIVQAPEQQDKIKNLGFQVNYMDMDTFAAYAKSEEERIADILSKIPN
jgi:tripartite-type tricarboxylate transporter receptor subunit TctC